MNYDKERLVDQLIRHEGMELKVYKDSLGIETIGIGRNLVDRGVTEEELDVLGEVLSNLYGAVEVRESIMRGKSRTDALNNFMKKVTSIGK